MIEEFLSVLVDGVPPRDWRSLALDEAVRDALDDHDATANYALHALRGHAAAFSLWPMMARSYEALAEIARTWAERGAPAVVALRDRLEGHLNSVRTATFLATEQWRVDREAVYADMYEQSGLGLRPLPASDRLAERLTPDAGLRRVSLQTELIERISARLGAASAKDRADGARMAACIADFLLREQAVLTLASEHQRQVNTLLGRAQPVRPFSAVDIDIHNRLQGTDARRLPYLIDELEALLGARIAIDPQRIDITHPRTTMR